MAEAVMFFYQGEIITMHFVHPKAYLPVEMKKGETLLLPWGRKLKQMSALPPGGWATLFICTGFALSSTSIKTNPRITLIPSLIANLSSSPNKYIGFSDSFEQHFKIEALNSEILLNLIHDNKLKAKIDLKENWRVIATTNVGEFYENLSDSIIDKILSIKFKKIENESGD